MEMPSDVEQAIAEAYVLERPLIRPSINISRAVRNIIMYLVVCFLLGVFTIWLFSSLGIFDFLPNRLNSFRKNTGIWFYILYILFVCFIAAFCMRKKIIIGCIQLYQHYAPEQIRRRCLFKPTCSEYAILAIKKYGLVIGLIKTYIRLFKKCRGNIYRIDYP